MRLRFGCFTFDAGRRQLFKGDSDVHVSPKAFDLLKILVERRPEALAKTQLQQRLWPQTFVLEANLPSLIGELRKALDDDPRQPRFIRTVQRFGYAFCGNATEVGDPKPDQTRTGQGVSVWLIWKGRRLELGEGENVIGRDPDATVHVDAASVSRRHARITVRDTDAVLEDLGSKNGTFLSDRPVSSPTCLRDGDSVRFGSVFTTFRVWSPEVATKTARARERQAAT